ncbi:MAG: histidine kinase [Saprospiraceae bacterium]|nr:histidine kinase [Saprospiraceae bacterium]
MKITLPQYSSKDYQILIALVVPISISINLAFFGKSYFGETSMFLVITLITGLAFCAYFILCGGIAVQMKKRFPEERDTGKRLLMTISIFLITTATVLFLLFGAYEKLALISTGFNEKGIVWAYLSLGIVNIFLTFLFEGIARYDQWKLNFEETEELRNTYQRSQLRGLRNQVNPHFLFNCLNSLSSLIADDSDQAESFLNEMSKVYRYLLQSDTDQLVPLQTELNFLDSYLYLLDVRFGQGMQVNLNISESNLSKYLPPLALQALIEIAFIQNIVSKSSPLKINISSTDNNCLSIYNNLQPKITDSDTNELAGLQDLIRKYELLNRRPVTIDESFTERRVLIPLLDHTEITTS